MNCYLRWLKKTGEFCFATQLFTTVLKSKLSDTFPRPLEKDWGSQMTAKLPIRVITFREIENYTYSSGQMKRTQHRPVVLNLITALETNGYSSHPTVGKHVKNDELWLAFSIARLFELIIQEDMEAELASTIKQV